MYKLDILLEPAVLNNPYKHLAHWGAMEQMEHARRRLYQDAGSPLTGWVEKGLFLVVAGLNVQFLREIKEANIRFFAERFWVEDRRFFLAHGLELASGKTALKVSGEFAFLSSELKRATVPPQEFCDAISSFINNGPHK